MLNIRENGMPSGIDYGYCMKYGEIDNGDYIPAIFWRKGEEDFTFVVERKDGKVVFFEKASLFYEPVCGVDQAEWMEFIHNEAIPAVDRDIDNV